MSEEEETEEIEEEEEDAEDEESDDDPEPEAPKPKAKPKSARQKPKPVPKPPKSASPGTTSVDDGLSEHYARHQHRLKVGYSIPGQGGPLAQGVQGWQEEWEVIAAHGLQDSAQLWLSRMIPPGHDGKPVDIGSIFPSQVPGGPDLWRYIVDNYALPDREIKVEWRVHQAGIRRVGHMRIPAKKDIPSPPPIRQATKDAPAAANPYPPPWAQPPAHFQGQQPPQYGAPQYPPPGYGAPPGYGQPPPQYPGQYVQQQPPPIPPPPPGTPPEVDAYIRALSDQLSQAHADRRDLQGKLVSAASNRSPMTADDIAGIVDRIVASRLQNYPPQQPAPQHAPAPVAPTEPVDPFAAVARTVEQVDRIRGKLAPDGAPTNGAAAPETPTVEVNDPAVVPVTTPSGTMLYDRDGNLKTGDTLFANASMLRDLVFGAVEKVSSELIKVKQAPDHNQIQQQPQPQQQQAPSAPSTGVTPSGAAAAWKK